jgi:hypothetical protein
VRRIGNSRKSMPRDRRERLMRFPRHPNFSERSDTRPMPLPEVLAQMLPGLGLCLFGCLLIRSHRNTWKSQQDELELDDFDRRHFHRRYRRRMQASGLIVLIGALLIVGLLVITKEQKLLFGVFWLGVLLLTFWLILLAVGDALSIAAYSRSAQARLNEQRKILETELERLRSRQGNGHTSHGNSNGDPS